MRPFDKGAPRRKPFALPHAPFFDGRGAWRDLLASDDLAYFDRPRPKALMAHFGYF